MPRAAALAAILAGSMRTVAVAILAGSMQAVALAAIGIAGSIGAQAAPVDPPMRIDVVRSGDGFLVDAELVAPGISALDAWAVLTDFDRMSAFVPNLLESRVTRRSGNRLTISQRGIARFGVLHHAFETIREVELHPYERILSWNIGGNVTSARSVTSIVDAAGGAAIHYWVEIDPGVWFAAFVGEAFFRHEVREQFVAIVAEMTRRKPPGKPR